MVGAGGGGGKKGGRGGGVGWVGVGRLGLPVCAVKGLTRVYGFRV